MSAYPPSRFPRLKKKTNGFVMVSRCVRHQLGSVIDVVIVTSTVELSYFLPPVG